MQDDFGGGNVVGVEIINHHDEDLALDGDLFIDSQVALNNSYSGVRSKDLDFHESSRPNLKLMSDN